MTGPWFVCADSFFKTILVQQLIRRGMSDTEDSDLQQAMEFDIPPQKDDQRDFFLDHDVLQQALMLDNEDSLIDSIFDTVAGLCDPYTQPEDNDTVPLSVSCLADATIALTYHQLLEYNAENLDQDERPCIKSLRFQLSTNYLTILDAINKTLRCDDPIRIEALLKDLLYWELRDPFWLPDFYQLNDYEAKLSYYMACVLVMAIYKLFLPEDGSPYNPALNPYTDYFIRLWRSHTGIIKLAFELDHDLEQYAYLNSDEYFDTPEHVKRALLGSSAVRSVLAYVLNQTTPGKLYDQSVIEDRKAHEYDVSQQPLLDFYDPLTRKRASGGALTGNYGAFIFVQLILRFDMHETRNRIDDFLRAIMENDEQASNYLLKRLRYTNNTDYARNFDNMLMYEDYLDEDIKYVFFGYADSEEEEEEAVEEEDTNDDLKKEVRMALRSDPAGVGVDEEGVDWNDCPRGQNIVFSERFLKVALQLTPLTDMREFEKYIDYVMTVKDGNNPEAKNQLLGQRIVDILAKCIKDEAEKNPQAIVAPGDIYEYLVSPPENTSNLPTPPNHVEAYNKEVTRFEYILISNPAIATSIIDEILMCGGFRRTFIWFITHLVNYSPALLNYIYELAIGMRGSSEGTKREIEFSRKGHLELSIIERLMLLHECFSNLLLWIIYFDKISHLRAKSLISLASFMIRRLVENGVISTSKTALYIDNYKEEIEFLLMPFVGDVPEARELFFEFKSGFGKNQKEKQLWNKLIYKDAGSVEEVLEDLNGLALEDVSVLDYRSNSSSALIAQLVKKVSSALRRIHNRGTKGPNYTKEDYLEHVENAANNFRLFMKNYNVICHHMSLAEICAQAKDERLIRGDGEPFALGHGDFQVKLMGVGSSMKELQEMQAAHQEEENDGSTKKKKTKKKKKGKKK